MKPYLKKSDLRACDSFVGWDGISEIGTAFGQADLRNEAVSIMRKIHHGPPNPEKQLGWIKAIRSSLLALGGIDLEDAHRNSAVYVAHPYLEILRSQFSGAGLRTILTNGPAGQVAQHLQQIQNATSELECKKAVRRFEIKQGKREDSFHHDARAVVKNRPWMTVLWGRLATVSPDSATPAIKVQQLKKALERLVKNHEKKWPTCFTYAVAYGYEREHGGYYVDVVFFFDANEERELEVLAKSVLEHWGKVCDAAGLFRHVGGLRRLYKDQFRPDDDPSLYSEKELRESVANILACLAKRDSQLHLKEVKRACYMAPIEVPRRHDDALPSSVAASVVGVRKNGAKSGGKSHLASTSGPDYLHRYGAAETPSEKPPAPIAQEALAVVESAAACSATEEMLCVPDAAALPIAEEPEKLQTAAPDAADPTPLTMPTTTSIVQPRKRISVTFNRPGTNNNRVTIVVVPRSSIKLGGARGS